MSSARIFFRADEEVAEEPAAPTASDENKEEGFYLIFLIYLFKLSITQD